MYVYQIHSYVLSQDLQTPSLGAICFDASQSSPGEKDAEEKHDAAGARPLSPKPLSDGVVLTILLCSRAVAPVSSR